MYWMNGTLSAFNKLKRREERNVLDEAVYQLMPNSSWLASGNCKFPGTMG